MSEQKNLHDVELLYYWKSHQWRSQFNVPQLTQSELPEHQIISEKQIENIEPLTIAECSENEKVWLALKLYNSSEADKLLLPLWIPAQIIQGKINLRTEAVLPWIPGIYFYPHSQLYFQHIACYEDFLRYDCLDNNKNYVFSSFIHFQYACLKLLDSLFESPWQAAIDSLGLIDAKQWLLFKSSNLMPEALKESVVLKNYSQFENKEAKDEINSSNFYDYAHLIQAQRENNEALNSEALKVILSILSLKNGALQAIKAPIGTDTKTIIQEIIINQYSAQALGKKEQPIMAVYSPNKEASSLLSSFDEVNPFLDEDIFIRYCQKILATPNLSKAESILETAHKKMIAIYEDNLQAMGLVRTYLKMQQENAKRYNGIDTFLKDLEKQDETIETERLKYLDIHAQWQSMQKNHTFLQKCFSIIPFVQKHRRKKASKFLDKVLENESINRPYEQEVIEHIRSLKVKQAKNDQKRIKAVDFLNLLQSARSKWLQWVMQHHGESKSFEHLDIRALYQVLAPVQKKLWQLCSIYWQARSMIQQEKKILSNVDSEPSHQMQWDLQSLDPFNRQAHIKKSQTIDYLFIDAAHLLSPIEILPVLSRAKRVIFFGDNPASIDRSLFARVEDEYLFKTKYNILEEDLEYLQASGHLLSAANAFQVAQNNSEFQKVSPCGLSRFSYLALKTIQYKNKQLFQYWNEFYCQNQLVLSHSLVINGPSISLVPVQGKMYLGMNVGEIEKIVSFIKEDLNANSQVAIITPFYHQQKLLSRMLESNNVTTHTFEDLPQTTVDFIIFSPVYTSDMPRPYIFDEGPAYFYRLFGLAKKAIWILGDTRIFDEHMHSPSGQIAKLLKNKVIQEKQVEQA